MHISTVNVLQTRTYSIDIITAPDIMSHVVFRLAYLELTLTYAEGQLDRSNGVSQTFWPSCYKLCQLNNVQNVDSLHRRRAMADFYRKER